MPSSFRGTGERGPIESGKRPADLASAPANHAGAATATSLGQTEGAVADRMRADAPIVAESSEISAAEQQVRATHKSTEGLPDWYIQMYHLGGDVSADESTEPQTSSTETEHVREARANTNGATSSASTGTPAPSASNTPMSADNKVAAKPSSTPSTDKAISSYKEDAISDVDEAEVVSAPLEQPETAERPGWWVGQWGVPAQTQRQTDQPVTVHRSEQGAVVDTAPGQVSSDTAAPGASESFVLPEFGGQTAAGRLAALLEAGIAQAASKGPPLARSAEVATQQGRLEGVATAAPSPRDGSTVDVGSVQTAQTDVSQGPFAPAITESNPRAISHAEQSALPRSFGIEPFGEGFNVQQGADVPSPPQIDVLGNTKVAEAAKYFASKHGLGSAAAHELAAIMQRVVCDTGLATRTPDEDAVAPWGEDASTFEASGNAWWSR